MEWYYILLIVCVSILFLALLVHIIICYVAGHIFMNLLIRCDSPSNSISKSMKVSYYDLGPLRKMNEEGREYLKTLEVEDIYMTSFDGLKLHAYLFKKPGSNSKKYMLGMHGFRSEPIHEYAHYAKGYIELGFNLVLPDERGHYKSEGKYISMGMNEKIDAKDWCHYLVKEYGEDIQILMQGLSMGGAIVSLASNLDLPPQVIGIVSDCGYYSYKVQIAHVLKNKFKTDSTLILNFLSRYVKRKTGVDFNTPTSLEAVSEAKVPIMFAHGESDEIVPVEDVYKLYNACSSRKILLTNKDANHVETMARDPETYFKTIKEFFNID